MSPNEKMILTQPAEAGQIAQWKLDGFAGSARRQQLPELAWGIAACIDVGTLSARRKLQVYRAELERRGPSAATQVMAMVEGELRRIEKTKRVTA